MHDLIKYRSDIDGLRALAILSVFLFHLNPGWLSGGFIGVDFFFVISGYLITRIVVRECQSGSFSFMQFYARRVRRIFPALFAVLLGCAAVSVLSLPSDYYGNFFKSFGYASAQASNFFFARKAGYFDDGSDLQPLLHTWSLGVEEQFYLAWPLLIFLCFKLQGRKRVSLLHVFYGIIFISFLANLYWAHVSSNKAFYMFYTRAWEFCFGGIVALDIIPRARRKNVNEWLACAGLALVVGSVLLIENDPSFLKWPVILPCLGAAIIIHCGQSPQTRVHKILSWRPLVFVGLISYSLYLWHWPVIAFYKHIVTTELDAVAYVVIIALSFALASLSYYYVEKKTRYIAMPDKKIVAGGAALIALFILFGAGMGAFSDAKWRIQNPQKEGQAKQEELSRAFFNLPPADNLFNLPKAQNHSKEKYDALLIGDSHAAYYFPIIYKYFKTRGMNAKELSIGGCPPLVGDYAVVNLRSDNVSRSVEGECDALKERILEYAPDPNVKYVLIAMRQDFYTETTHQKGFLRNRVFLTPDPHGKLTKDIARETWKKNLEGTIQYLKQLGKKVILLGEVPMLNVHPQRCAEITLLDRALHGEAAAGFKQKKCSAIDADYVRERLAYSNEVYRKFAASYNLGYFDPTLHITSAADANGTLLYKDGDHINIVGARALYPFVRFY